MKLIIRGNLRPSWLLRSM